MSPLSPLVVVMCALLSIPLPRGGTALVRHIRRAGGVTYVETRAADFDHVDHLLGLDVALHVSLLIDEAALRENAVSRNKTSVGVGQLNRKGKHYRRWRKACRQVPSLCTYAAIASSGYALREALDECGGDPAQAVKRYRSRTCTGVRPRDERVVRIADRIRGLAFLLGMVAGATALALWQWLDQRVDVELRWEEAPAP